MKNFILVSFVAASLAGLSACDSGFDSKSLNAIPSGSEEPVPTPTPTPDPTIPDGTPCGEANLSWTNPTTYIDGTPITQPLSRNIVFFGFSSTQFSNSVNVTNPPATGSYRVTNLQKGRTYFFAVKAVDHANSESDYSAIASKTINVCPTAPLEEGAVNEIVIDAGGNPQAESEFTLEDESAPRPAMPMVDDALGAPAAN